MTDREPDTVRAVARGGSTAEITEELFIGVATVESHHGIGT